MPPLDLPSSQKARLTSGDGVEQIRSPAVSFRSRRDRTNIFCRHTLGAERGSLTSLSVHLDPATGKTPSRLRILNRGNWGGGTVPNEAWNSRNLQSQRQI